MTNINILGRVTKDIEVKTLATGTKVANFTVVSSTGKDGLPIFWDCCVFGNKAEFTGNYFSKGSPVYVTGQVSMNEYTYIDKDNNQVARKSLKVNVDNINFVPRESKKEETTEQEI